MTLGKARSSTRSSLFSRSTSMRPVPTSRLGNDQLGALLWRAQEQSSANRAERLIVCGYDITGHMRPKYRPDSARNRRHGCLPVHDATAQRLTIYMEFVTKV